MKLFRREADPLRELRKVLTGAAIPHFPAATLRILARVREPETSMQEIAEALRWEPGLVVRVMAAVNSAAFGPAQEIRDIGHAASYLGRAQLEQLVLGLAVGQALPTAPAPGYDAGRFWRAAARRATLARILAEELHPTRLGESFTVGLLQDMAIPVLAHARTEDYGPVLDAWHADGPPLADLERTAFGWSHADVGGMLAKAWNLPAALADGICGHHTNEFSDRERLPAIRLVAMLRESEQESHFEEVTELARSDYGLQPDFLVAAAATANERAAELARELA